MAQDVQIVCRGADTEHVSAPPSSAAPGADASNEVPGALQALEKQRIIVTVVGVGLAIFFLTPQVPTRGSLYLWGALVLVGQPLVVRAARLRDPRQRRRLGIAAEVAVGVAWGLQPVLALPIEPEWQAIQAAALVPVMMSGASTVRDPVRTPVTFGLPLSFVAGAGLFVGASSAGKLGLVVMAIAWVLTMIFQSETQATLAELDKTLEDNNRLVDGIAAEHERLERAYAGLEEVNGKLDSLARTDPLTGLANRLMFTERLRSSLDLLNEGTVSNVGLAYLDLDGFKQINDGLGHKVGDQLLVAVAERLRRDADAHGELLARLGGDELVVLGVDVDAADLGQRLLGAFASPFSIEGRSLDVGTSVGVVAVVSETDPDAMLRFADAALYRAKGRGGGVYELFGPELRQELDDRRIVEQELHRAFVGGQIKPYLQPIVHLRTGAIVGAEALARWEHESGVRSAAHFIDVMADLGLIDRMSELFLEEIQSLQLSLGAAGVAPMQVALNVPPAHLERLLRRYESSSLLEAVVVEITEDGAFANIDRARAMLDRAREAGMQVLLDDFGVGFSSLSLATQLPVDGLKVDRSFVSSLTTDQSARAVVSAVVQLARGMDLDVIAEGIESVEQLEILRELGVEHGQGFLFSPAVPIAEFETWIRDQMRFAAAVPVAQSTSQSVVPDR